MLDTFREVVVVDTEFTAITGERPALPPRLASLMTEPERFTALPNDLRAIERFVEDCAGRKQGAAA